MNHDCQKKDSNKIYINNMKHQKIIANNIKIRQILSPIRKEKNQNSRNFRDKEPK